MDAYCWLKRLPAGLLVLIISWHSHTSAAAAIVVSSEQARYDLNEVSSYWNTLESLNLRDVLALSPSFKPVHRASDLHFGYTQSDVWLKTQIHNASPRPTTWMVKFEYPFLDHITLYTLREHTSDVQHSGIAVPIDERSIAHRQAVFPVMLLGGETVTLYTPGKSHGQ